MIFTKADKERLERIDKNQLEHISSTKEGYKNIFGICMRMDSLRADLAALTQEIRGNHVHILGRLSVVGKENGLKKRVLKRRR